MPDVFDEEAERARLYRDNWDKRIAFRMNQLGRLAGDSAAYMQLWEAWNPIFRKDNYISDSAFDEPDSGGGGFETPDEEPGNEGSTSGSPVLTPAGARRAGAGNP